MRLAEEIATAHPDQTLATHMAQIADDPIEPILAAARDGDINVRTMLEDRARYMGIGLANLIDTLSPELIVLGGIFEQAEDMLFPVIRDTMRQRAFAGMGKHVRTANAHLWQRCRYGRGGSLGT